jgi:sugar phosphate isomerase/epimerase
MKRIILCDDGEFDVVFPFCFSKSLGIELQSFWNPNQAEQFPACIEYQLEKLRSIDFISFHGTFGDLNCGSYDPKIRAVSLERMAFSYQTACKLNATHIVFHHGYVPHTSPEKYWIPRFVETWKSFLDERPEEMRFHLENMLELSPEIMIETIDSISDPRVSACLDIGHAHCNSTTPVLKWIEKLGSRISYVHIHDNDGTADQHLAIDEGNIPMKDVCNALNEYSPDAVWALECQSTGMEKSYEWLKVNGFSGK